MAAAVLVAEVLEAVVILEWVVVVEEAMFAVILILALLLVAVEFVATEVDVVLVVATNGGWGADLTARSSRSCRRADKKQIPIIRQCQTRLNRTQTQNTK